MKNFYTRFLIIVNLIVSITACDLTNNNNGNENTTDKFLVSYEFKKSYNRDLINLAFNQLATQYSGLDKISAKVQYGVSIYKISYHTTFNNEQVLASGLVCIPVGDGTFPILSYQNGTNTLHSNAPSVNPDYELYVPLELVASTGFVVVIPDYLGFGDSENMFHPYLDKESTIRTVIDMLRATKEVAAHYLSVNLNDDLYIAGYSMGGWATMQVEKEIEQKYMDEFNLKASACGAGPYDLNYINQYVLGLTTYPRPYFLGYIFNSYTNTGAITTPIDEVFKEPYASKILTLYDGTKSDTEIDAELTTNISDLFTADYIANYNTSEKYASIKAALEANSISAWDTKIPTLIIHGMEDNFVPKEVSTNIYQNFLALGAKIDQVLWLPLPGLGHVSGIIPSGIASVSWFLDLKDQNQ